MLPLSLGFKAKEKKGEGPIFDGNQTKEVKKHIVY